MRDVSFDSYAQKVIDQGWLASKNIPNIIYHYTDASGLIGILKSHALWATEYRFVNDQSEIQLGLKRSIEVIENLKKSNGDKSFGNFLKILSSECNADDFQSSYVVSFTSKKDDLSQWRGYASDGHGFSIGFSTERIASLANNGETSFGNVTYNYKSHDRLIKKTIVEFWENFRGELEDYAELKECCEQLSTVIYSFSARYKHSSFSGEDEWRVHFYPNNDTIKVRSSGKRLIPYCEMEIKNLLPIVEIGIGPAFRSENNLYALERLLSQHHITADIYFADTPFRANL